jgi:hypothetical protein
MTTVVTVQTGTDLAAKVTIEQGDTSNSHIVQPANRREFTVWDAVKLTVVEYDDSPGEDDDSVIAPNPEAE